MGSVDIRVWGAALALLVVLCGCGREPVEGNTSLPPASEAPEIGVTPEESAAAAPVNTAEPANQEAAVEQYRHGRTLLSQGERSVYDALSKAAAEFDLSVSVPVPTEVDEDGIRRITRYLYNDNPEFYWATTTLEGGNSQSRRMGLANLLDFTPEELRERQGEIEAAARELSQGVEGTGMEAIIQLHDKLGRKIYYNKYARSDDKSNLYGGLVNGEAVCDGYVKAFHYLLNRQGVTTMYVAGTSNRGIPHSWVAVLLEGEWYYIDLTWNDQGAIRHDYFGVTLEEMEREHYWDTDQYPELPRSNATEYCYYTYHGFVVEPGGGDLTEQFARASAREIAYKFRADGEMYIEIKVLGTDEEYRQIKGRFIQDVFSIRRETGRLLAEERPDLEIAGDGEIACNYNDTMHVLTWFPTVRAVDGGDGATEGGEG